MKIETILTFVIGTAGLGLIWVARQDPWLILQPKVMIPLVFMGIAAPALLELFRMGWRKSAGKNDDWIDRRVD